MKKKFNQKKAIAKVKKEAKKLPKNTLKQIPNAALFLSGGASAAAVKGVRIAARKKVAKKAAKKGVSYFKLAGQKKRVKVTRR